MAKVILTIEDTEDELNIELAFEPMVERGKPISPAQTLGLELANELRGGGSAPFTDWQNEDD